MLDAIATDEKLETEPLIIDEVRNPIVTESKLSMLSRPNKVTAFVPDLYGPEESLKAYGLQKEGDKWFLPNREYFPNPLDEDSIVINYGRKEDGSQDLGFCARKEFEKIYANPEDYEHGQVNYIMAGEIKKGDVIKAVKCATGEFTLVPEGTIVKTNEGKVVVKADEALIVNEAENSIFITKIPQLIKRYVPDPMNPASEQAFLLLRRYGKDSNFGTLVEKYNAIDRNVKAYEAMRSSELPVENLREDYKLSSEIVRVLDEEISPRINSLKFEERIEEAREVLRKVIEDPILTPEQKDIKISYILARLLPKTNNHQHLKGSVPMETTMALATSHHLGPLQLASIQTAYEKGREGFENLNEFNDAYGTIGSVIRTPDDYQAAIRGIVNEATKSGQLTVEIRCSVIGQKDASGNLIDPNAATENILQAISQTTNAIGQEAPKTGFTFLGYRGRDWHPDEVTMHAKLAVEFAQKYPDKKFSFDIAGPEDTGYSPLFFKEAYDLVRAYNNKIKSGELKGELIGVTTHAGETPSFDNGRSGGGAIEEALEMGVDRIGHGIQAITNPETLDKLKRSGVTVEICGVCNISSIPLNTRGMALHPVQEFMHEGIPITVCTDNDGISATSITKEYAQFLLTGHNQLMNWNNIKKVARHGIEISFVPDKDKADALKLFDERIRIIERMFTEEKVKFEEN